MDSFEWNKIAGAVLFALLVVVGLRIGTEILFEAEAPESPGYVIATAGEGGGGEPEAPKTIAVLLASADATAGANSAKKCLACHSFGEGEANKVGPNLYGVVMRKIAAHEGYQYSDAMHAFAAEAGEWTFEHLNTFLHDPAGTVPGTKMTFAGLKNDQERANVIDYLRSLAADPVPLPAPEEAAPAEEAAAAEGSTAPAEETAPAEAAPAEAVPTEEPAPAEEQQGATETPAAEQQAAMAPATEQPAAEAPAAEQQTAMAPAAEQPAGDPVKGEAFAKRCQVCHSFDEGGPNKVGPHLFGVLGRPIASIEDYSYSDAMKAFSEGGTKHWDAATLDTYLTNPREVVPGTKMVFPGVKDGDRANVIAYLSTLK